MVGDTLLTERILEHRTQGGTRHFRVEEMPKAVGAPVFAGGVVGVGEAGHEDDARFLAKTLNRDRDTGGRAAGDHHGTVLFDHALGTGARGIRLRLGVTGDERNFLAVDAVALEFLRGEGVEHAAVTFAIEVLNSEFVGAQLVCALVGIGTSLRNIETEGHRGTCRLVGVGP